MNKMEKVNINHIEIILKYTDHSKLTTKDSNANKKKWAKVMNSQCTKEETYKLRKIWINCIIICSHINEI